MPPEKSSAPFPFDHENPLVKCPRESRKANKALQDYFWMGATRSIRKLFERYRKQSGSKEGAPATPEEEQAVTDSQSALMHWSTKYSWQERVDLADAMQTEEDQRIWMERHKKTREKQYNAGMRMMEIAAEAMKEVPHFIHSKRKYEKGEVQTLKDGSQLRVDREIITVSIGAESIKAYAIDGAKTELMAEGMATDHTQNDNVNANVDTKALDEIRKSRFQAAMPAILEAFEEQQRLEQGTGGNG